MSSTSTKAGRPAARQVIVGPDRCGQRLDNFLSAELGRVPRSLIYRLVRTGQVRVNGGRAKPMHKLKTGDSVRLPPVQVHAPEAARLPDGVVDSVRAAIVHRQDELMVLDKPAGMAVHRGTGLGFGLVDVLAQIHPGWVPVHRLDRGTSGLIVFADGRQAAVALQRAFRAHLVDKRYLALLCGRLPEDRLRVDAPLKKIRDASGQHRVIVADDGDPARSEFRLLEQLGEYAYVEVSLETGRTHQIRAHAAHLRCPLAGDDRYNLNPRTAGLKRLFLHAHRMRLPWPTDQVFSSPLPPELDAALDRARHSN